MTGHAPVSDRRIDRLLREVEARGRVRWQPRAGRYAPVVDPTADMAAQADAETVASRLTTLRTRYCQRT